MTKQEIIEKRIDLEVRSFGILVEKHRLRLGVLEKALVEVEEEELESRKGYRIAKKKREEFNNACEVQLSGQASQGCRFDSKQDAIGENLY